MTRRRARSCPAPAGPCPVAPSTRGADGIVARYFDGRTEVLDAAPAGEDLGLAFQGRRVYWQTATGPRTALLNLPPETAPAAKPLRARKMTNCTPRRGANLVARYRRVVVTRKGKSVHVCFNKRTTPIGNATAVERVNQADVAYTRPGYVGYLDAHSGKQRELPSAGGSARRQRLRHRRGRPQGRPAGLEHRTASARRSSRGPAPPKWPSRPTRSSGSLPTARRGRGSCARPG